jgi:hypothetical protein
MTHLLSMLHSMTTALRRRPVPPDEAPAADPGDDPALCGLSPRDLADLPFPRPCAGGR